MTTKITRLCIALIGLCAFSSFRLIQNDPITELLKKLDAYTKKYPQEKVYLHLDKPYYAVGDDIWFKAYIVDSRSSELSLISGFLYVDLIDETGKVQQQVKLKVVSGTAQGDFKLEALTDGNYRIRAYTQHMRNAGPEFFFDKTIKIGNSWTNEVFVKSTTSKSKENNQEKIVSTLSFTDKAGKPYVGNNVNYQIETGTKKTGSGNLSTNNNGEVQVPLLNPSPNFTGQIKATITLPNKEKVVKLIPIKNTNPTVDVQFFAEGGNLVGDLPNRLAIKATNNKGLGEKVSGQLVDNNGTEVGTFETNTLGMGSIYFTPLADKKYTAHVKFANGTERQLKLPEVAKSGYVLSINNTDSAKMAIKVAISADLLNKGDLTLIGQRNGEVYLNTKIQSAKQFSSITVNKSEFVSGIIQLTLFSPNNMPVCERLAFINNQNDKIGLKITGLKPNYDKRENLKLDLTAISDGAPVVGTFSVAVTNARTVVPDLDNESNILTGLLLTGDLTGFVEKPNRYFLESSDERRTELDNLMLTQGWRKINWKTITDEVPPVNTFEPETELKISGTVYTLEKKPVPNAKVNLFSTKMALTRDTLSDKNGKFSFRHLDFPDSTTFLLNAFNTKGDNDLRIVLDTLPNQLVSKNRNMPDMETDVNGTLKDYLNKSSQYFNEKVKVGLLKDAIQLKEIEIEKKRDLKAAGYIREGRADITRVINQEENPMTLTDYIPRIPGLYEMNGLIYTRAHGTSGASMGRSVLNMLVIVDGITQDFFRTSMYMTSDIEKIEVLTSASNTTIYGSRAGSGVIQITTRKGPTGFGINGRRIIKDFLPKGYFVERDFYVPSYEVDQTSNQVDLRTTVYWNPYLLSDKEGKFKFNYFNTDQAGNYRIVIEGIDDLGNLARKVYHYTIN